MLPVTQSLCPWFVLVKAHLFIKLSAFSLKELSRRHTSLFILKGLALTQLHSGLEGHSSHRRKKRRSLTSTNFRLFHHKSAMVPLASSQLCNVLFTGGRFCPWPSIAQAVTPQGQHRKVAALCSSLAPLLFLIARNLH